jgi:hypothetical protein
LFPLILFLLVEPMSNNPAAPSSPATQPTSPPAAGGGGRLIGLLVLLGVAIVALAFDYLSAGPTTESSDKKIESFVDDANSKGVSESKRVTPDEIHKLLGHQPTWVDKHPDDHYEVEYYCGWGMVPVLNMRRHYLAVVYIGDEPRRYSSHYKNEPPPIEALPIQQSAPDDTGETVPLPISDTDAAKAGVSPPDESKDGANADGAKKRKGKKKQEAKSEDNPPQEDKPAAKPEDKPEEKKPD